MDKAQEELTLCHGCGAESDDYGPTVNVLNAPPEDDTWFFCSSKCFMGWCRAEPKQDREARTEGG